MSQATPPEPEAQSPRNQVSATSDVWSSFRTISGRSLAELADERPTLLVMLRHSGCPFCREALADLKKQEPELKRQGTGVAIVYQEGPEQMQALVKHYGLTDIEQFSDPERRMYEHFQLRESSVKQFLSPGALWRGFQAAILGGHGFGRPTTSVTQMPGAFLVHKGKIVKAMRHKVASDRPDYGQLACPLN